MNQLPPPRRRGTKGWNVRRRLLSWSLGVLVVKMAAAMPLGTYTKGSDGSAAHQFMNPCKVVVKADPGISSVGTFWLQPQAYTFAGTAVPALGWHAVRVEYKNASNQTVVISLNGATSPAFFSVALNLTGVSNYAPRLLFKVLFATNRFRYGSQEPEYEEYIQISATVLNASSFIALDADGNGLRDAWEIQYFGKVGNDPTADADWDGLTNLQEQTVGTNPVDPASVTQKRIAYFPLDATNFVSAEGQTPRTSIGVTSVPGFKGNAARIATIGNILKYDWKRSDGSPNYAFARGSVRLWFKPDWSSDTMSRTWSRLFEVGGPWSAKAFAMLLFNATYPSIIYSEHDGNGHYTEYPTTTPFIWTPGSWHQIVVTYSRTTRKTYIDGNLAGETSLNWTYSPKIADIIAAGLTLGNESPGNQPVKGAIDEAEFFNYELPASQIATDYDAALRTFNLHITLGEDTTASVTLPIAEAPNTTCAVVAGPQHGVVSGTAPYLEYKPYAHYNGSDSFTVSVTRGGTTTATATVSLTITPVNDAPLVDAGANRTITLAGTPATVSTTLHATVTDIDSTVFTYQWSLADGPAQVTFTAPTAASTSAQFTTPGLYKLRVNVSDGIATRSDTVLVLVNSIAGALSVTLQDPGSAFSSPAAIPLVATVSGGTPARVDFYEGSRQIGSDSSAPYAMTWWKSGYGAYRVTAVAVDAAGHTVVSAPLVVSVQGQLGIAGSGADSGNGPGNDGDSNSGGDGGAGPGGSGSGSGSGSDDGSGGGGGIPEPPPPDPNSDDDGDGVLNGTDLYPYDYRRSEDVSPIHYAVIDLGKDVIPADKEVDQIAMGQDGRVAFSWRDGSDYKVAKWKDGKLTDGSPKSTATQICFAHYSEGSVRPYSTPPDSYTTPYPISNEEWITRTLNANGDVAATGIAVSPAPSNPEGQGIIDYTSSNFAIWTFGNESANERCSAEEAEVASNGVWSGLIDSTPLIFLDNGTVLGTNGWDAPWPGLTSENLSGVRKWLYHKDDITDIFPATSQTWASSESGEAIADSWVISGPSRDWAPYMGGVTLVDLQGNITELREKDGADAEKAGTIQAINDSKEFILADSDLGKFVSYTGTTSHGKLEQLLPEKYSKQTRYGSDAAGSSAKMEAIANNGTILFTMENLEGKGSGDWVKDRQFLAPKIPAGTPGAVPFGHDLHVLEFPDNYKVQLLGGPQGITDTGLLAAKIKKTKKDDGTPIPEAQQKWSAGLLTPVDLQIYKPETSSNTQWQSDDYKMPWGKLFVFDEPVKDDFKFKVTFPTIVSDAIVEQIDVQIGINSPEWPKPPKWKKFNLKAIGNLSPNKKEVWCTVPYADITSKVRPQIPAESQIEFVSFDWVDYPEASDFGDSDNFDQGMKSRTDSVEMVNARGKGNNSNLSIKDENNETIKPWTAKANKDYLKQGGAAYIDVSLNLGASTEAASLSVNLGSVRALCREQADWLYLSVHGMHSQGEHHGHTYPSGVIILPEENGQPSYITPEEVDWKKDLEVVIIGGCSVLDINDYNNNYPNADVTAPTSHTDSPGKRWEQTGPDYLLGYAWGGPADKHGGSDIIAKWVELVKSMAKTDAWRDANKDGRSWNACAIKAGEAYYYFDIEKQFGHTLSAKWTKVPKSEW